MSQLLLLWGYLAEALSFVVNLKNFFKKNEEEEDNSIPDIEQEKKVEPVFDEVEYDYIQGLPKLDLDIYAREKYKIKLDRRQTQENMIKQLEEKLRGN